MKFLLPVAALVTMACGGGDDSPTVDAPPAPVPDGAALPDVAPNGCPAPSDLGDPGALEGDALQSAVGTSVYFVGNLDAEVPGDHLWIELYPGTTTFPDAIEPGTYDLGGDNAQYSSCGACVTIFPDWDKMNDPDTYYLAIGGTLVLEEVATGLRGTLTDVQFQHVSINWTTAVSTPIDDGCASMMGTMSFDEMF